MKNSGLFLNVGKNDDTKEAYFGIDFRKTGEKDVKPTIKPKITNIDSDGPSHDVLKEKDLILELNKKKVKNVKDFFNIRKKLKPGELVYVRVKRRRQELTRVIRIISLYEFKNPSKQNHQVRLGVWFNVEEDQELKVIGVLKKFSAYKILQPEDIIQAINGILVKNIIELNFELKKISWGEKIKIKIIRKKKIIDKEIQTTNFYSWKNRSIVLGISGKLFKKKYLKITHTNNLCSEENLIKKGDIILSIRSKIMGIFFKKNIKSNNELTRIISNYEPTQRVIFEILRGKKKELIEVKLLNFNDFLKNNESLVRGNLNKPKADFLLKEYKKNDYQDLTEDFKQSIIDMEMEEENLNNDEFFISTSVKKEKVSGKDCFVLYFNDFPDMYDFEDSSVSLKVYVFDVTDLNQEEYENIYYENEDYEDNPKLENYIRNNCHIIKTENFDWSEGSMNLVQKKLLNPDDEPPEKIAFPFSAMHFPKAGKRKLSFRTFICTDKLKFHETEGRPLNGSITNYRPEHFKIGTFTESFDEYDSYPEILAYDSIDIEAEYKQAGYLGVNRQKLDSLIIPVGLHLAQIKNNDLKKSLKIVKDNISLKGDETDEGAVNQTLTLKKFYYLSLNEKIDPKIYLKEIRNHSKIDERYELINLLLNIATDDQTLIAKENSFLDDVAKKLELNQIKYQEIKRIETSSLKQVDFGDKADESIFGIIDDMDNKEKCRILRKEYTRWNSQTNNNNKIKRNRAKEMINLVANLRKQYNC